MPHVLGDGLDHFLEVVVQHSNRFFGTELLGKIGKAAHVGEKRGDFPALAVKFRSSSGVDNFIENILRHVARQGALEIFPLLQAEGHLVEGVGDFPEFIFGGDLQSLIVISGRNALDGVPNGDQRLRNLARSQAGQQIRHDKGDPHRQRAVPKKPFQALHDFRRTHIDAHRSHRLVSRIANRRVRGQPQTPLIPDKILVGLKIVEANNVVWIGALVDVSDVGLVDPVFLGIQDKLGRGGIAGIGAHRVDVLYIKIPPAIRVARPSQRGLKLLVDRHILVRPGLDLAVSFGVQHGGHRRGNRKDICPHEIHEQLLGGSVHEGRDEQAGQNGHDQKKCKNSRPKAHRDELATSPSTEISERKPRTRNFPGERR